MATAVPAWKLTAFGVAIVGAFVFFGPVRALLVVAVCLLAEMIIRGRSAGSTGDSLV
jgi:hypothetical protein